MRWTVGEAARNVGSGTSGALRSALVIAAVVGSLVALDVVGTDQLLVRADGFRAAGGSVLTITAPGLIDATACDALGTADGVRAAGAIRRESTDVVPEVTPRGPLMTYAVSAGLLDVLGAETADAGVVLSEAVADRLDLTPGDMFVTTSGSAAVSAVFAWPDDGRKSGFAAAVLIPTADPVPFDECWVDAFPIPPNLPVLLHTTVLPDPTGSVAVTQGRLNASVGDAFDGPTLYVGRITRFAVWAGLLAGFAVGFSAVRARRVELSSARHLGASMGGQVLGIMIEAVVWISASLLLVSSSTAMLLDRSSGLDPGALLSVAVSVALPAHLSVLLGAALAVTTVRERHLARYVARR